MKTNPCITTTRVKKPNSGGLWSLLTMYTTSPSAILKSFTFPQELRFILCIYQKHQLLSEFRAVTTK